MRHTARQKKKKPLKLFTKQKLHSKSTYFYSKRLDFLSFLRKQFTNGFWENLSSSREDSSVPNIPSANRTRFSLKGTNPYSKLTYGGIKYVLPAVCMTALLLVLSLAINPTIYNSDKGYALGGSLADNVTMGENREANSEPGNTKNSNTLGIDFSTSEETSDAKDISGDASANTAESANDGIAAQADLTSTTNDASVSLVVDDGVITDTILADTGTTTYRSHTITIKGDNLESYTLQISATSDGTSTLQRLEGGYSIAGAGGKKGSALATNTWGYGWGATTTNDADLTYYTLPAYGTVGSSISNGLLESAQNIAADTVDTTKKLTFAANFGNNAPDGHYTTSVMLSLAVEPKVVATSLADARYMQNVTPEVCTATPEADTAGKNQYQLIDKRDGKSYWVAKLKDGKCWMTQNLDLDLNTTKALTSTESDVDNWTPGYDTWTAISGSSWSSDNSAQRSFDPGDYYYSTPNTQNECPQTKVGLSACVDYGWKPNDTDNNLHYHAGNYYAWITAVAGKAPSSGNNATSSICPKGWRLPTGGDKAGELYDLLNGLTSEELSSSPYYLVRGGDVSFSYSALTNAGDEGKYWSGTRGSSTSAYHLRFISTISIPTYTGNACGMSVRCVAR